MRHNIILLIGILFFGYQVQCQEIQGMLDWNEIYGLQVEFKEVVLTSNESCGIGALKSKSNTLYKIEIKDVIYSRDSTVFNTRDLLKVKYIVIPSDLEIALNYKYDILAGVSSTSKYIVGYRIFFTGIIQNYIESPVTRPFLEKCPCKRQSLKRIYNPNYPIEYRMEEEENEFMIKILAIEI